MAPKRRTKAELLAELERARDLAAPLRGLLDGLPAFVFQVDERGRLLYANRRVLEVAGCAEEGIRGLEATAIVVPEDRDRLAAGMRDVLQGEPHHGVGFAVRGKDGSRVPVAVHLEPVVHVGRVVGAWGAFFDISGHEPGEAAEGLRQELLAAAFQLSPAFSIITRVEDGRILEVSDAFIRALGFEREEVVGRTAVELGVLDAASFEAVVRVAEEGTQASQVEVEMHGKSGQIRVGRVSARVLSTDEGAFRLSVVTDVTDQRRAENALRESELFLSNIYRGVDVPMYIVDLEDDGTFRHISANPEWERFMGLRSSDIAGRSLEELEPLLGAEAVAQTRLDLVACLEAQSATWTERTEWHRGSEIWTVRRLTPFRVPTGGYRIIGTIIDVTASRQSQMTLRLLDFLWETGDGVLFGDLAAGKMLDVNGPACRLMGFERSELLGMTMDDVWVRFRGQAGAASPPDSVRDVELRAHEGTLARKDGTLLPVEVNARRVRIEGREFAVVVVKDISDRRRSQELQESLRRSETLSAMGRLVGGVAHEVRNPLFAISATLDAWEDEFGDRPEHREYVGLLRAEVERMTSLMQSLLEYGKPPPTRVPAAPIQDVVLRAVRACDGRATAAGVVLQPSLPQTPLVLPMDRERLQQVFQNLIENATQHSPRGAGVRISVQGRGQPGEGEIVCIVEDSGPGFREEDLDRVFEPFFTRRKGGTGLGLAIVMRIVAEHGGDIGAANRPQGGAVMTVRLPWRRSAQETLQ